MHCFVKTYFHFSIKLPSLYEPNCAPLCNKIVSLCDNPRKQLNKFTVTVTQFLQEPYTFDVHVPDLWPVRTIYVGVYER